MLQLILTGFTHETGFRVFAFDRVGEDRTRTKCTVRADLTLIRTYGIQIQDLPLLCKGLLSRHDDPVDGYSLTFTEEEMQVCANERAAAREIAASKRKTMRRPATENLGAAWRTPHP